MVGNISNEIFHTSLRYLLHFQLGKQSIGSIYKVKAPPNRNLEGDATSTTFKWSNLRSLMDKNLFRLRKSCARLLRCSFDTKMPPLSMSNSDNIYTYLFGSVFRRWQLLLSSQQNSSRRVRLDSPTPVDCSAIAGFQEGHVLDWKSWQYSEGLSSEHKVSTPTVAGEAG